MNKDELPPLALELCNARGWDDFTRTLMLAGKQLSVMPESYRTDANHIDGCESAVWLACVDEGSGPVIMAYSPSKIIRGVLAVLLEKANQLPEEARRDFDFSAYLVACQLSRYLSESRGNGIKHVVNALSTM
jgi:cysteine desulfuration protein SufE